jgi:hypothetical protein
MFKPSFVASRLQPRGHEKQFVRRVESGETPEILRPGNRRYTLKSVPKGYDWQEGERVVLVALTGAGVVPTSIYGTFVGIDRSNGRKAAMVRWDKKIAHISGTVAFQRIRPIALILDHD